VQGTSIGDAISVCDSALNINEKKPQAIVLITDGEDHDTTALSAAYRLKEKGIVLFTVGIGTATGAKIPQNDRNGYKKDDEGSIIISKLNEPLLKNIAAVTNGKYFLYNNDHTIANLRESISGLEQGQFENINDDSTVPFFWVFAVAAFLLLAIEVLVPELKYFYKNLS
jgi:Ca-activated chloride channel family protein